MDDLIHPLPWDSELFSRRVGRLTIGQSTSLESLLNQASQSGYELLYIYSPFAIQSPSAGSFSLLDVGGHITFTADLSECELEDGKLDPEILEYHHTDLSPELLQLAFLSGHLSRFRIDPSLPAGSFERLYENWLTKTLARRPRAAIYTYRSKGEVAGLVSAEWDEQMCTIGLLAVLEPYQGRGIGYRLINHLKGVSIARRLRSIQVKTQLTNARAQALYRKSSFAVESQSFLYHGHRLSSS